MLQHAPHHLAFGDAPPILSLRLEAEGLGGGEAGPADDSSFAQLSHPDKPWLAKLDWRIQVLDFTCLFDALYLSRSAIWTEHMHANRLTPLPI
ncbi:hypothetical protein [Aquabacterium soli]|uniref:hypothetical protein n=1 Tax=Aquabacterium soli TaxID=2493092 RepID=UPI001315161A|nr:hypothetical protein [Aquabacterium soli]